MIITTNQTIKPNNNQSKQEHKTLMWILIFAVIMGFLSPLIGVVVEQYEEHKKETVRKERISYADLKQKRYKTKGGTLANYKQKNDKLPHKLPHDGSRCGDGTGKWRRGVFDYEVWVCSYTKVCAGGAKLSKDANGNYLCKYKPVEPSNLPPLPPTKQDTYEHLWTETATIRNEPIEHLQIFYYNSNMEHLGNKIIGIGNEYEVDYYPHHIKMYAKKYGATRFIPVHNHPGGDCKPSLQDEYAHIRNKRRFGGVLKLYDSVVVSSKCLYSHKKDAIVR